MADTSHVTTAAKKAATQRGAATTDPRLSAGTSQAANADRNLATISEEVTATQGTTSRYPQVKAGISAAVSSEATRNTSEQKGPISVERETAPGEKAKKGPLSSEISNVKNFLRWRRRQYQYSGRQVLLTVSGPR